MMAEVSCGIRDLLHTEAFEMSLSSFSNHEDVDALLFDEEIADFDFDFSDLDSTIGCTISESSYPSSLASGVTYPQTEESTQVTVLAKRRSSSPTNKKILKRKGPTAKCSSLRKPFASAKAPNTAKRSRVPVLVAFPTFDKCDSLVFFPTSLSRCMNSGDFDGLSKLVDAHMDKGCQILMKGQKLDLAMYLELSRFAGDMHPDTLVCVRQTKVVEDTIQATMYSKFTDCKVIHDAMAKQMSASGKLGCLMGPRRSDNLKGKMDLDKRDEEERERLCQLAESDLDLTVYTTMYLSLKYSPLTRKIVFMEYRFEITSVIPAGDLSQSQAVPSS